MNSLYKFGKVYVLSKFKRTACKTEFAWEGDIGKIHIRYIDHRCCLKNNNSDMPSMQEISSVPIAFRQQNACPGFVVIKFEYSLRLKIKRNDWLLADTCPQAANHSALFRV